MPISHYNESEKGPVPAGWFPDPAGSPRKRYWDGEGWTGLFHPQQVQPPPAPALEAPTARGRRWPWVTLGLALVVALGAGYWVLRGPALERQDPNGFRACQALANARDSGQTSRARLEALLEAGQFAGDATTPSIQQTASPLGGLRSYSIADVDQLEAACERNGVDIPDR